MKAGKLSSYIGSDGRDPKIFLLQLMWHTTKVFSIPPGHRMHEALMSREPINLYILTSPSLNFPNLRECCTCWTTRDGRPSSWPGCTCLASESKGTITSARTMWRIFLSEVVRCRRLSSSLTKCSETRWKPSIRSMRRREQDRRRSGDREGWAKRNWTLNPGMRWGRRLPLAIWRLWSGRRVECRRLDPSIPFHDRRTCRISSLETSWRNRECNEEKVREPTSGFHEVCWKSLSLRHTERMMYRFKSSTSHCNIAWSLRLSAPHDPFAIKVFWMT